MRIESYLNNLPTSVRIALAGLIRSGALKNYLGIATGTVSGTVASPNLYADDATITVVHPIIIIRIAGDGAAALLDTDPAISDGSFDGQELELQGCSDTNTVTIADGCNTQMQGGVSFTLKLGSIWAARWDAGASVWRERYRSSN